MPTATTYEAPSITVLGSIRELTQSPTPPGKMGAAHDASQFVNNFGS